ncbi:hypothetical protein [Bifidobacterium oedipodis]|uniref:Uncharacterized protein n=1 Tax=Bifidobacterium oedipodis TaxID=2675322 RepID=A0A7Y0EPA9_9BIFI|nr:hypothetical protein [Bifidobacterium sp. DSM 109957]NMM93925.1 hypothetical protein [Bifidobacterium sp. DSM 109957]
MKDDMKWVRRTIIVLGLLLLFAFHVLLFITWFGNMFGLLHTPDGGIAASVFLGGATLCAADSGIAVMVTDRGGF